MTTMTNLVHKSLRAALFALLVLSFNVQAQSDVGENSHYNPSRSTPFFVLTDTQYGSEDNALLRVEIPVNDGGMGAVAEYGGIDVLLYRVPEPLKFLQGQKNLHRVDARARPRDEGIANTLSYLWSNAWNKSRNAWRDLFSGQARQAVRVHAPALKTHPVSPDYHPATHFKPLEGYEIAARFRYPLMVAKPIEPQQGVGLAGSSSNFIEKNAGNFYIPLGKLQPGLYLAEAMVGTHRAATLVFVSNTVAITKLASGALTVWTADRANGQPVSGAKLQWTDGRGVLASATTDAAGLASLKHVSPERTYLLGQDADGGVFVSENFYYDSEIYDTKLYTVSDRPLYRSGDLVNLRFFAREYKAANLSLPAEAGKIDVRVFDPNGTPIWTGNAALTSDKGADAAFRLPEEATAGGYEIRSRYKNKVYSAAFRVAEYVKPHFEITLVPDKPNFKTGEAVSGKARLTYPNGKPVKNANVELTLRAQTLSMAQGELRYGGLFPVELSTASLTSNDNGEATFSLPPAKEPSRLILSLLATDGAAYRVRHSRELLVERAAANWRLFSARKFSMPGEEVRFALEPENENAAPPATWEIIRLEDQSRQTGKFDSAAREWKPRLERAGSYSLLLRDDKGNLIAATAYWVGGEGVQTVPGTIEMVANKERYQTGEIAEVLITFSEPVEEALLTLERDKVEAASLLSVVASGKLGETGDWVYAERLAPNQYRARIHVRESYAPNMTFSVVYVKNGEYVFQNAGLVVETARLALDIKSNKKVAQPGDTVTIDIAATLRGKPAQAVLTVSVVDEMIYALQPEIAPDMVEFFQHVRRNNVRTGASLNFITYEEAADYAADAGRQPPARHQYNERGVKVLERARRDDTDTAAWEPALVTDAKGKARLTFKMPDALSRWRITVRAVTLDKAGKKRAASEVAYGQRVAYVQSDKPLYAKWTSPDWLREGDAPVASLAVFNNTSGEKQADVILKLADQEFSQRVTLKRGVSYLPFKLPKFTGAQTATLEVREVANKDAAKNAGKLVDALETPVSAEPAHWRGVQEQWLALDDTKLALKKLPADAKKLRLQFMSSGSEHFLRIADSLIEYPWGCAEQTSSRLIPLSIAASLLTPDVTDGRLRQMLYSQRLRLAALAGPNAVFGWWGNGSNDSLLMTSYAYYADWRAAQTLGLALPAEHWERLLAVYRERADREPLLHRVLALWFAEQIGLPVRTQLSGVLDALPPADKAETAVASFADSPMLVAPDSALGLAYAHVLATTLAKNAGVKHEADASAAREAASKTLRASRLPSARALLLLAGEEKPADVADILATAGSATPTLDRALTLVWTQKALGANLSAKTANTAPEPAGDWKAQTTRSELGKEWRLPEGSPLPTSITLNNKPSGAFSAVLRFEANESADKGKLPIVIKRQLYRLEKQARKEGDAEGHARYAAVPVKSGEALSAQDLYLDEITLNAKSEHHYGIVEAPLPPGASIEHSTWGVDLVDGEGVAAIERSKAEEQRDRYGVPVEYMGGGSATLRHLLRVAQSGRFVLPPARYYRMYQPEQKAYEDGGNKVWQVN
ncbi:MAG: alpha-2-macroglobulin family protein [Zoogloeaceae bacterium]|jgi:uncharacterized protein YfaS (alpha-2-macroglobulin family)|nr:alpha-2-macroglobulin family protein [Zoogloeaceae bacterium]